MDEQDRAPGEEQDRLGEADDWQQRYDEEEQDPKELFKQVSHIGLCMSYDLIDKLRWYEKETLKLSDEEVAGRLEHMSAFLQRLKIAYLEFADMDL